MAKKIAKFKVESALLEELGERLVSSPEVALTELVKNSYDADASRCTVTVTPRSIVVQDDGNGMRERDFLDLWMVIGTRNKARNGLSKKYHRKVSGSKGIGRFAVRFLGSKMPLRVEHLVTFHAAKVIVNRAEHHEFLCGYAATEHDANTARRSRSAALRSTSKCRANNDSVDSITG